MRKQAAPCSTGWRQAVILFEITVSLHCSLSKCVRRFADLFIGRISKKIDLKPLTPPECAQFWAGRNVSAREILTMLCVTGGVPRYLEEIKVNESADWNIRRLCFDSTGLLVQELPNLIKTSLLNATRDASLERYLDILAALTGSGKTHAEIVYIRPNLRKIGKDLYRYVTLEQLAGWEATRGLQFEALIGQSLIPVIRAQFELQRFDPVADGLQKLLGDVVPKFSMPGIVRVAFAVSILSDAAMAPC